jgi:hypothetical protein
MEKNLYEVLDFILNRATEKDLMAVQAAMDRRAGGKLTTGKSLSDMVTQSAAQFQKQMKVPMDQIRNTVRDMVVRIIRQNAPDIPEDQLNMLVNEWVPDEKKKARSRAQTRVPGDVLITMITQFIAFSVGKMPKKEDMTLRKEMPDWPAKYWNAFPESIQILISNLLKGQINEESFWKEVYQILG